jgi:hypothetical protein
VQASEIEKNAQEQENQKTIAMDQPQVARPLPTPPSTQPPKNAVVTQVQRRGSGIVAAAAPVFSAAAAAASVEAQKALAAKCPHCQAFMTQAKEGGMKGVLNHTTSLIAPVLQNTAADAFGKLKSRLNLLALANKIL